MAIQIGKYKRNGIFIEEIDKSVFTTPVSEGITNLVIGVSKKGPVNTPIRLTSVGDLEAVFGQLDRNLERKGSFFHRTVAKMLESSPVYAMNLLITDDTLDEIEYQSLSTSAGFSNGVKTLAPYRRFFDTTGFWKKDTESFINLTKNAQGYSERLLNFTNLSDRHISVFVVKTQVSGFDRTLLEWYGSADKMPAYTSTTDYASDYMVDVIVIGGDWSNYRELAVDTRWSQYFNANGLIKGQLRSFANDRNINLLGYYEGLSLIPYFRDLNNRNIFIENVINRETERTGLYCAFNADLLETDYYTGLVDLMGGTLIGEEKSEIDFLSYRETIVEENPFSSVPLDMPGNVVALFGSASYNGQASHAFGFNTITTTDIPHTLGEMVLNNERTAWFAEGSVFNVGSVSVTSTTASIVLDYNSIEDNAYVIISDTFVNVVNGPISFEIKGTDFTYGATATYTSAVVLGLNGEISLVNGTIAGQNPAVLATDIVLDFITFSVYNQVIATGSVSQFEQGEYVEYGYADPLFFAESDYFIYDLGNGSVKVEFFGTNAPASTRNYSQYKKIKTFNKIISIIDSSSKDRATLLIDSNGTKRSLSTMTISNIVTSTSQNKSFILNTGDVAVASYLNTTGSFILYKDDNELILGTNGVMTTDNVADTTTGVVARYSDLYSSFLNGNINTGDFFYDNRLLSDTGDDQSGNLNSLVGDVNVTFFNGTGLTYSGYNYIVFEMPSMGATAAYSELGLSLGEQVIFPESDSNKGIFTISDNSVNPSDSAAELATELGFIGNFFAYEVVENVIDEEVESITVVYNALDKHYLKMFLTPAGGMELEFVDSLLESVEDINVLINSNFIVKSELNNLKQTLEIETVSGYTEVPNKILVNGARYTEIRVGDFLEADLEGDVLELGEVSRKFTRVLSKRQYVGDTTLTEISCDAAIRKVLTGDAKQAMRYSTIDQYATTYKAIALKGFKIRQASLPDGTEAKQNQVLNLVAKGTPLFKALTNKEAFDFRYLVDSFGLGLTERSKQQLVDICGARLTAFAFINMPSLKSFKASSSPSFVNSEGVLQAEFIAKGGDPESNPAFLYSFGDGDGVTTAGYFLPYVTVNDNGRPLEFPPASFVATTYMRKFTSNVGSITPWTIAAGVTNGRVTGIAGLEQEFDNEDVEFFTQAQMNPIVLKRTRGYVIDTESTALTLYKSSLSSIHAREVLIELERELSAMLLDYQWKFNTPDVRAEIKLRADVICETFVNKNGIYDYFNKMDGENNTNEIIDNQIGVLDTYIEVIKGMGIIVNNITILRTGAIASGGFLTA